MVDRCVYLGQSGVSGPKTCVVSCFTMSSTCPDSNPFQPPPAYFRVCHDVLLMLPGLPLVVRILAQF